MKVSRKNLVRPLALVATIAVFLAAAGCDSSPKVAAEVAPAPATIPRLVHQDSDTELLQLEPNELAGVAFAKVQSIDLPGVLETTGQVSFDDRRVASIVSRVAGRIEQVHVSQWDNVRRGQPIVTLYSPDFMTAAAEYLQAKQTALALAHGPSEDHALALSMVDAARNKLELLGIEPDQIAMIKSAAPSFTMRAPISGSVTQNQALRGSAVNPGDVLYSVGTLDEVWITADVYEDDAARVQVGQRLQAVTTAYPDRIFHGTISRISPSVDPATHTLQIRCRVANPGLKLKPQMLAQIRINVQEGQAVVVPLDALVFETDSYFAYVDAGADRLARRKVVVESWNRQGYARVVSGLKPGEQVVTDATIRMNELWHEAHGERS